MKDDRLYLIHMAECIARIQEYAAGGREEFLRSRLIQDGIMRNLQTLAESSQRLSKDLKTTHPDVPWRAMAGFRNVLVHDYLGVDIEEVWRIVESDLPRLKHHLSALLTEMGCPPPKP